MRDRRDTLSLLAILACALALRLANAWYASLHLDDFHSLHHARAASLAVFFEVLRTDNHPPLFFLLLRATRSLLGENEFLLRLPAVLCGTATVFFVWRMSRRLATRSARVLATCLVAFSSLNLELSADLRMYSMLTLSVAGWLDAALDLLEERRGAWRLALWSVVGLHTHYHFVHVLAVLVPGALALARFHPSARCGVSGLVRPLAAAGVVCLAWFSWGFPFQLRHGLAPGGASTSPELLVEGMVHMVFLNLHLGGEVGRPCFLAAGLGFLALATLGAVRVCLRERAGERGPGWLLLVAAGFLIPVWSAVVAALVPRAGFEWRYIAGAVVPLALLTAQGATCAGRLERVRAIVAWGSVAAALLLAVLNIPDPGREDNRAAVRAVLARAQAGDGIVAAEWQPRIFPHSGAWNYYAPRLLRPGEEMPILLDYTDDFTLASGTDLSRFQRVFFLGRSIPDGAALLRQLRAEFVQVHQEQHGYSIHFLVFERRS